ncbi:DUF1566 domain-containing protein [Vibrio sp. S9_S30]|uniref:DUF1566 domain-containing protein n=1 Tax=Vibrio sp. S9_S30 TaxID=2720226 RepID=UPI00168170A6|nr:DUF1566 domain-containing protein [Vibrio sp. S9_S30]MBD1556177.1 DUF1566 domain-containing protein [Vibrio sp. S9_S30]
MKLNAIITLFIGVGIGFSVNAQVDPRLIPSCVNGASHEAPVGRFTQETINTDVGMVRVVNDHATGLQWQYCLYGHASNTSTGQCEGSALNAAERDADQNKPSLVSLVNGENTRLGETTNLWRIPNANELLSIYQPNCSPSIYTDFHYVNVTTAELEQTLSSIHEVEIQEEYDRVYDHYKEHFPDTWQEVLDNHMADFKPRTKMEQIIAKHFSFLSSTRSYESSSNDYRGVHFGYSIDIVNSTWLPHANLRFVRDIPSL